MSKPRTGAPKRVAVGLLAGSLAIFGVAFAPSAGATATVTTERLAGVNRYGTAAAIAGDEAFATPAHVIVATGENFPDALAASTLSGANAPTPILLTETAQLTSETSSGLDAIKAKGVTAATIVGGTAAVSTAVQTAITAKGFTVTRVAGTDRYETAAAIANAADAKQDSGSVGGQKTALIATGLNFPDALAGGPAAVRNDLPLLLVNQGVPASTRSALQSLGITRAVILGGTAAVSEAVATEIGTIVGTAPTRLAGINRFGTAAAVGDYEITTLAFPATAAILATGSKFPDALASGPLGGQLGAPIVLTSSLPEESRAFLDKHSNKIAKLYVAGGTAAIDDATVAAAVAAAQTVANDVPGQGGDAAVTSDPELIGAAIVNTVTTLQASPGNAAGTRVRYSFDEAVTGAAAVPGNFKVYTASGTAFTAAGGTATIDPADNKSVLVNFTTIDTTTVAGTLTVATVVPNAVTDNQNQTNPIGDAPIGAAGSTTVGGAGITTAPDLVSVGNFRASFTAGNTIVDFTFDEVASVTAATGVASTGFSLIPTARATGAGIACSGPLGGSSGVTSPSGGTSVGGNGTTVISVECANNAGAAGNEAPSATNVARGTIAVGTVVDGSANDNALQAADVASSGNSNSPDLVSVQFVPGANSSTADQVVYTFDEAVAITVGANTLFNVYDVNGNETNSNAGSPTRNPSNATQVSASFPNGTLATMVGASVEDGAVTGTAGSALASQEDEVGVENTQTSTQTPGRTNGPDLTAAAITVTNDVFGNPSAVRVTYTFDEDTTDVAVTPGNFFIELADGTSTAAGTCDTLAASGARTEDTDNTVGCTAFGALTVAQMRTAVKATVAAGAVVEESGGTLTNPEGASVTTGGSGTPAA